MKVSVQENYNELEHEVNCHAFCFTSLLNFITELLQTTVFIVSDILLTAPVLVDQKKFWQKLHSFAVLAANHLTPSNSRSVIQSIDCKFKIICMRHVEIPLALWALLHKCHKLINWWHQMERERDIICSMNDQSKQVFYFDCFVDFWASSSKQFSRITINRQVPSIQWMKRYSWNNNRKRLRSILCIRVQ